MNLLSLLRPLLGDYVPNAVYCPPSVEIRIRSASPRSHVGILSINARPHITRHEPGKYLDVFHDDLARPRCREPVTRCGSDLIYGSSPRGRPCHILPPVTICCSRMFHSLHKHSCCDFRLEKYQRPGFWVLEGLLDPPPNLNRTGVYFGTEQQQQIHHDPPKHQG